MIGAIIGDMVGSRYEFKDFQSKEFIFFTENCEATDDSYMTLAVAKTLSACRYDFNAVPYIIVNDMKLIAKAHPNTLWGERFYKWLFVDVSPKPYNSYGNGAAMRISPVGWVAKSEEEVKKLSDEITKISHNHPEGLKGAEAIAMGVYLARIGKDKNYIVKRLQEYYPQIGTRSFMLDVIRPDYHMDEDGKFVSCQGSVPQAIQAFVEGNDFEDCIRNAISLGGDADTIACMTGSIAEAFYGVPDEFVKEARKHLTPDLLEILDDFDSVKIPRVKRQTEELSDIKHITESIDTKSKDAMQTGYVFAKNEIKIGAVVEHKVFGKGIIVETDKNNHIQVKFDNLSSIKVFQNPQSFENGFLKLK